MEGPTPKDLADILKESNMQGAPPLEDFAEWVKQFFVHIDKKKLPNAVYNSYATAPGMKR